MDVRESVIDTRFQHVKRVLAVASGKGGVGKSMVASHLALHLKQQGHKVGLLDLDLYGPSSHIILGVDRSVFPKEEKGIIPPKIAGISFMSIVYFSEDKPSAFRGEDITNIILELLAITQWGNLDYLVIDMPPGIGDEILDVIRFIKKGEFIVVTTPSKVAMGAVSKLLNILKELNVPIVGVVENMVHYDSKYVKKTVEEMKMPHLGKIHFDPTVEQAVGKPEKLLNTDFTKELSSAIQKEIV